MKTFITATALLCASLSCRAQADPRAALIHELVQLLFSRTFAVERIDADNFSEG